MGLQGKVFKNKKTGQFMISLSKKSMTSKERVMLKSSIGRKDGMELFLDKNKVKRRLL